MRHGDIKTTLAYYANVDDAVKEAILGPGCNRKCNNRPAGGRVPGGQRDGTACLEDGSGP
jgi:hypothetical protein